MRSCHGSLAPSVVLPDKGSLAIPGNAGIVVAPRRQRKLAEGLAFSLAARHNRTGYRRQPRRTAMSIESPEPIAIIAPQAIVQQPPAVEGVPAPEAPGASAEEVHAVDAVFSERQQPEPGPGGLFFAYSAGMLLRDVLKDTFTEEAEEEEPDCADRSKDDDEAKS